MVYENSYSSTYTLKTFSCIVFLPGKMLRHLVKWFLSLSIRNGSTNRSFRNGVSFPTHTTGSLRKICSMQFYTQVSIFSHNCNRSNSATCFYDNIEKQKKK